MKTENEKHVNMRFPSDVHTALKQFAQEDSRSFHSMVIWILRDYIKRRIASK